MRKGDLIELDVTDINNLGCGVGRYEGKVVFVKGAVSGDFVRARIIKDNKSFCVGRLEEVLSPSKNRIERDECSAPLSCGGCVYRHVTYEHEKKLKRDYVRAAFLKAGLSSVRVSDTLSTERTKGYRNKGQYPVCNTKDGMKTGFYASKTHTIIPSDSCAIQNEVFAAITARVCSLCDEYGILAYDESTGGGLLRHIYLRIGEKSKEVMLCLVVNADSLPREKEIAMRITEEFPFVVSVMINKNTENTNVVLGDEYRTVSGKSYIEDELCGLRFKITPQSFYQVNRDGAELLYGLASKMARLDGTQTVCDLYCGTGTIGLSMANGARSLVGIEIVESAVECARANAADNQIRNAEFFCADAGRAENILAATKGIVPDVVVIDPPRKGSTRELAECLSELGVKRIVYISCNPDTLARDCVYFSELGYSIGEVTPVDMFPRTGHVETIVCLCKQ